MTAHVRIPHPDPDEELRLAAKALAIAAYEFAVAARKGSLPIPREDIHAVMRITDEWADLTASHAKESAR